MCGGQCDPHTHLHIPLSTLIRVVEISKKQHCNYDVVTTTWMQCCCVFLEIRSARTTTSEDEDDERRIRSDAMF